MTHSKPVEKTHEQSVGRQYCRASVRRSAFRHELSVSSAYCNHRWVSCATSIWSPRFCCFQNLINAASKKSKSAPACHIKGHFAFEFLLFQLTYVWTSAQPFNPFIQDCVDCAISSIPPYGPIYALETTLDVWCKFVTMTFQKVLEATTTFKPSKASGANNIPTEFGSWDMRSNFVVLQMGSEVLAARYEVADMTWEQCHTPVVSKGDPASCKNYRPLSRVSYKFFVSILLNGEQVLQTGSGQGNSVFGLAMLPFCFAKRMLVQSGASKTSAPRFLKLWMAQTPSISYHTIGSFSLCTATSKCVIADIRRKWSLNFWTCLNVVHRHLSFCSTCFVLILFLLHAFAKISLVLVNEVETEFASKLTYLNYDDTPCGRVVASDPKQAKVNIYVYNVK